MRYTPLPELLHPLSRGSAGRQTEAGDIIGRHIQQFGGYTATKLIVAELQPFEVVEVAQFRRYRPAQLVVAERQRSQVVEVAQFRRYRPAQLIAVEVQHSQVGEVAQVQRYRPAQLVAPEGQLLQVVEVAQFRRYRPATGCPGGSAVAGCRGCPVPTVSTRSTAFASCRGCPVPTVSVSTQLNLPSCRYRAQLVAAALARLARLPSSERYRPAQLVVAEVQRYQVRRGVATVSTRSRLWPSHSVVPSCDGIDPLNWLLAERTGTSRLSRLPSSEFRRYRPAQLIAVEVAVSSSARLSRVAQSRRCRPAQLVAVELFSVTR